MTHEMLLGGCTPTVLAGYLKALGIHRLVSQQLDGSALSRWDADGRFFLTSTRSPEEIAGFFLDDYAPTPLVTPWNGGGGFFPGDQQAGIQALADSSADRFAPYRAAIATCREALDQLGVREKPDKDQKQDLLRLLRATLSDEALAWLDAAVVIGDEDAAYPPILGTGGNDGRLDFANNFMQRVAELLLAPPRRGNTADDRAARLHASLFGVARPGALQKAAVGQFAPAMAGGTNMSASPSGEARVNPWDYVLFLEGTLAFAGAAVRRLEAGRPPSAVVPFHLRASPVGYEASSETDRGSKRGELWLPCWSERATFPELARLFSEGRLECGRERASSGLEAARAVASLGVDRGIDRFERFGLFERNGLSHLAVWLGSFSVPKHRIGSVDLLGQIQDLLRDVGRLERPSADISAARRRLEEAIFAACRWGSLEVRDPPLTDVLASVGALLRAVGRSAKARASVRPLARLDPEWYAAANDGSSEFAIAAAFASWGLRRDLEPVEKVGTRWRYSEGSVTWSERDPLENLVSLAMRRIRRAAPGELPLSGRSALSAADLGALLAGGEALDTVRIGELLFGLSTIEEMAWLPQRPPAGSWRGAGTFRDGTFCLLRAALSPDVVTEGGRAAAPRTALTLLNLLRADRTSEALELAQRRLWGAGVRPLSPGVHAARQKTAQAGLQAALVVPLPSRVERDLVARAVRIEDATTDLNDPIQMETDHG